MAAAPSPASGAVVLKLVVSPPASNGTRNVVVVGTSLSFPVLPREGTLNMRVLVDRSIAEFFVAEGRAVVTRRAYPLAGENGIELAADAPAVVAKVVAHEMGCGWAS